MFSIAPADDGDGAARASPVPVLVAAAMQATETAARWFPAMICRTRGPRGAQPRTRRTAISAGIRVSAQFFIHWRPPVGGR